jgi:hypothetical protein
MTCVEADRRASIKADPVRREKRRKRRKRYEYLRRMDPEKWAAGTISHAKQRAAKRGVPFGITPDDVRAVLPADGRCPVLGTPLTFGGTLTSHSATLDRIVPSKGYVSGNIAVLSRRANCLKLNGSYREINALAFWLRKQMRRQYQEQLAADDPQWPLR